MICLYNIHTDTVVYLPELVPVRHGHLVLRGAGSGLRRTVKCDERRQDPLKS